MVSGEPTWPRIARLGEETWLIEFEPRLDPAINTQVLAVAERLRRRPRPGIRDIVPACASLAVHIDPEIIDDSAVQPLLHDALSGTVVGPQSPGQLHEIPVCYAPQFALDLDSVSQVSRCSPDEVVARHLAVEYRVYMLGFLPGFPYLAAVDERIAVARHATPRPLVPAGSVGIAGRQTGIYPTDSPGGWQIVGRTPIRLFDPAEAPEPRLRPGDRVRFVAIDADQFAQLGAASAQRS
jgi:inhibitor of KinA